MRFDCFQTLGKRYLCQIAAAQGRFSDSRYSFRNMKACLGIRAADQGIARFAIEHAVNGLIAGVFRVNFDAGQLREGTVLTKHIRRDFFHGFGQMNDFNAFQIVILIIVFVRRIVGKSTRGNLLHGCRNNEPFIIIRIPCSEQNSC